MPGPEPASCSRTVTARHSLQPATSPPTPALVRSPTDRAAPVVRNPHDHATTSSTSLVPVGLRRATRPSQPHLSYKRNGPKATHNAALIYLGPMSLRRPLRHAQTKQHSRTASKSQLDENHRDTPGDHANSRGKRAYRAWQPGSRVRDHEQGNGRGSASGLARKSSFIQRHMPNSFP